IRADGPNVSPRATGSVRGSSAYEYVPTSRHHSATFPCMSYKPNALGLYWPTGQVRFRYGPFTSVPYGVMPSQLACDPSSSLPNENAVVVPARHAHSHSASDGSENFPSRPRSALSFAQKAAASSQVTISTGNLVVSVGTTSLPPRV